MTRTLLAAVVFAAGGVALCAATPPAAEPGPALGNPSAAPRGAAFGSGLDPLAGPRTLGAPIAVPNFAITDRYELVVFARHRPIRIRVTGGAEGEPLADRWRAALKGAFEYFDRDGDGFLNGHEVRFVFSDVGLTVLAQSSYYSPTPQDQPNLDRLDRDGDRRVSFAEYTAYYKQAPNFVLRAGAPIPDNQNNVAVTEAIFKLLDGNGDGKLTQDEVKRIETLIASKDADEDECLAVNELISTPATQQVRGGVVAVPQSGPQPTPNFQQNLMAIYEVGKVPGSVTQRILMDFDKDGDFALSPTEIGFDLATFARLDTDRDTKLTAEELDGWRTGVPDAEIALYLSPTPANCKATAITEPKDAELAGFSIRQVDPGRLVVTSGRQVLEFWAFAADARFNRGSLKQQFGAIFQFAAAGKAFIEERDLYGQNAAQLQFLRIAFDPADRNGDGRLTKDEFDRYIDLQQSFLDLGLSLTPTLQTPSLFNLLDENRDGRLGVRELRTAWPRLLALEPESKTEVTRAVIQPSVSLRLTRTFERGLPQQVIVVNGGNPNAMTVAPPMRGPVWFRKMDRNGDGDLSRLEFLGSNVEFDAIDADRDDLISLEEAEAFDKAKRGN